MFMIGMRSAFCLGQAHRRAIYCKKPTCQGRKGRTLPSISFADPFALSVGILMGAIGFLPLLAAIIAGKGRRRSIAQGLVAVALSFAFLMAVVVVLWVRARAMFPMAFAGMLVGFFAMWAVLAYVARKRRL